MLTKMILEKFCIICWYGGFYASHSLAPEFSGKYLLVECKETHKGQNDSSNKAAWLKDLNVFVPVAEQLNDKPESKVSLENVSVIR
ncbi:hypothetical protein PZA22_19135 [Pectobacterium polaris]|uniref:hypothetical protein n=1 Tax=Pectobacterium polaris TaxID=2042057 RepID=UPI0023AED31A|nr:hypothetical protein [Pectobacterium polaris]MDE8756600.1 hypothetical protein [Pectobacterium polaris]